MSQGAFALDVVPAVVVAKPVKSKAKPVVRHAVKSLAGAALMSFPAWYATIPANGGKAPGAVASMVVGRLNVAKDTIKDVSGAKSYGAWLAFHSRLSSRGGVA